MIPLTHVGHHTHPICLNGVHEANIGIVIEYLIEVFFAIHKLQFVILLFIIQFLTSEFLLKELFF